jgi:hypothetical protein
MEAFMFRHMLVPAILILTLGGIAGAQTAPPALPGRLLKSFGAGMFVFPHGIFVDQRGNVWVHRRRWKRR